MRLNNMVLSMAMAQTQTEQISSPTITVSTIQWACQNRWNSDRLDDVNGATDCAMSPAFMGVPFRSGRANKRPRPQPNRHHDRHSAPASGPKGLKAAASRAPTKSRNFVRTRAGPATGKTEFLAKLVQTRAPHRSSEPNEARLCLMGG